MAHQYAAEKYNLPANDPRSGLPFINVPASHAGSFGFLDMAVLHWFSPVKVLKPDCKSHDELICFLGDTYMYLTKPNADVERCVRVQDLGQILTAAQGADQYIILRFPAGELPATAESGGPRKEHDIMLSSPEIGTLYWYLRQIYLSKNASSSEVSMVPIGQLASQQQLESEVQLRPRDGYKLAYAKPTMKEGLSAQIESWKGGGGVPGWPEWSVTERVLQQAEGLLKSQT